MAKKKQNESKPELQPVEVQIETGKVEDHFEPMNIDVVTEQPTTTEEKRKVKEEDLKPQAFAPLPGRPEPIHPSHALPQVENEKSKVKVSDQKHLKPQE